MKRRTSLSPLHSSAPALAGSRGNALAYRSCLLGEAPGAMGALRGRGKEEHPSLTTVICTLNMLHFLCCGNKIPYLLIKKGSVFLSYVLRGRGWKGFRLFPSRLLCASELQGVPL